MTKATARVVQAALFAWWVKDDSRKMGFADPGVQRLYDECLATLATPETPAWWDGA